MKRFFKGTTFAIITLLLFMLGSTSLAFARYKW